MLNNNWRFSPNEKLLLSDFPEGDYGGFWRNIGTAVGIFAKKVIETAGQTLEDIMSDSGTLPENGDFTANSTGNIFAFPQVVGDFDLQEEIQSQWYDLATQQALENEREKIIREPQNRAQKMQARLEAVDKHLEKNTHENLSESTGSNYLRTNRLRQLQNFSGKFIPNQALSQIRVDDPRNLNLTASGQTMPLNINVKSVDNIFKNRNEIAKQRSLKPNEVGPEIEILKRQNQQQEFLREDDRQVIRQNVAREFSTKIRPQRWWKGSLFKPKTLEQKARQEERNRRYHEQKKQERLERMKKAPDEFYKGVNVVEKVNNNEVLSDEELKQFLYHLDLKKHKAKTDYDRQLADDYSKKMKEKVAQNMVSGKGVIKHPDGYIVIGRQAYGTAEALDKARESVAYFEEHGRHLPPLPYPVSPNLKGVHYPDVTKKVSNVLFLMSIEIDFIKKENKAGLLEMWFIENVSNNKKWDSQVNYNLPGQVMINDEPLIFTDQYALFNGRISRSGYISNYVFGYAAAKAGYPIGFVTTGSQAFSIVSNLKLDNPEDQQAIQDGYNKAIKLIYIRPK